MFSVEALTLEGLRFLVKGNSHPDDHSRTPTVYLTCQIAGGGLPLTPQIAAIPGFEPGVGILSNRGQHEITASHP